jgi:glycosyltransferase involved in cell wall biosynthesis
MPVISIIVPVYKVEPYIRRCLDSVLDQTFTDFECILVDDGSPDACPAICDEYAVKDKRIKALHKENGGLSDARNTGIRAALGDYIVLLDSDDLLVSGDALLNLYNVIAKTAAPVIFNSRLAFFGGGQNKSYDGLKAAQDCFTPVCFYKTVRSDSKIVLAGWLFTVRRDFLLQHDLFFKTGILHEDEHWFPRVVSAADKIAINHSPYYGYRQGRSGSIMSNINQKNITDVIFIVNEFIETAKQPACPAARKKIYLWHAAQLWTGSYLQLPLVFNLKSNQYRRALNDLSKTKNILFHGRNYKYKLFGIMLALTGVTFPHIIKKSVSEFFK